MKFYSAYNPAPTIPSTPGTYEEPVYGMIVDDETGKLVPGIKSMRDLREFHNAGKESCDLHVIISQYLNGERDLDLSQKVGNTGVVDLTVLPNNLRDSLTLINKSKAYFESLPLEIRKKYNNDPQDFLVAAQDGSLKEYLESFNKTEVKTESSASEVSENES